MYYSEGRPWNEAFSDKMDSIARRLRSETAQAAAAKVSLGVGYAMAVAALLPHQSETLQHNEQVAACADQLADRPKLVSYEDINGNCEPFIGSFVLDTDVDERGNIQKVAYFIPSEQSFVEEEYWHDNRDAELAKERYETAGAFIALGGVMLAGQAIRRRREQGAFEANVLATINSLPELPES